MFCLVPFSCGEPSGGDEVQVLAAEVETSAKQDQGDVVPEVPKEGLGQSAAQPQASPTPPPQPEASIPATMVVGPEVVLPTPPTQGCATAGWAEEMEVSLTEEYRALIGTTLCGFWSV